MTLGRVVYIWCANVAAGGTYEIDELVGESVNIDAEKNMDREAKHLNALTTTPGDLIMLIGLVFTVHHHPMRRCNPIRILETHPTAPVLTLQYQFRVTGLHL